MAMLTPHLPRGRTFGVAAIWLIITPFLCSEVLGAQPLQVFEEPLHVPASYENADAATVLASFAELEFGLATAPAHVEDHLDDAWLVFARAGRVAAWSNVPRAEERTRFWSAPEVDIKLAAETGVGVFRLGVDWARLVPTLDLAISGGIVASAWARYMEIFRMVAAKGMKLMLTLFHHSLPVWAQAQSGWTNSSTVDLFITFATAVVRGLLAEPEVVSSLHSLLPFNEPHVFALLTYCGGLWPGGEPSAGSIEQLNCFTPWGAYGRSMAHMAKAHLATYSAVREAGMNTLVGVAHHVPSYSALTVFDKPAQRITESMTTFWFHDMIQHECDFIGINYYGREVIHGTGVALLASEEYSDAGRSIYPDGLYRVLRAFHLRYSMPLFITENGLADATDVLRPAYIIEHLLAMRAAMDSGVPVLGYVFWTVSDNWEWADGYCPKFGLAAVNRSDPQMARIPRPSYHVWSRIVKERKITGGMRAEAWTALQRHVAIGALRPFCRADDGQSALDQPVERPFSTRDWRFGKRPKRDPDRAARHALKEVRALWKKKRRELEEAWSTTAREVSDAWDAFQQQRRSNGLSMVDLPVLDADARRILKDAFQEMRSVFNSSVLSDYLEAQMIGAELAITRWRENFTAISNDFVRNISRPGQRLVTKAKAAMASISAFWSALMCRQRAHAEPPSACTASNPPTTTKSDL